MNERARTASAAGKVSIAVALSRILGLVREQVFAIFFGAGAMTDAWNVAFRVPNLFRDLFAEGALSSAFLPAFSRSLEREGRQAAFHLTNLVMTLLVLLLGAFGLFLLLFPRLPVPLLASGFSDTPGKVELTAAMIQILAPFLLTVALAALAMGILNAFHVYFLPALAPASFNVCIILTCLLGVPLLVGAGLPIIYAAAIGATIGGASQLLVQLPKLRSLGYRPRLTFNLQHPELRRIIALLGPAVIGIAGFQFNSVINTNIASLLGDGPVSWLNYAFRIMYLPMGLFAVAVGTVNLREVSMQAARSDEAGLRRTVADSVRLLMVLVFPSIVGLILLSRPIVRTLFEYGRFSAQDTEATALALMAYALALVGYSLVKVFVPTFYALDDTRTPVRISLFSVLVNLSAGLLLVFFILPEDIRFVGLGLAMAISVGVNSLLLGWRLSVKIGSLSGLGIESTLFKSGLASLGMALPVWAIMRVTASWAEASTLQGAGQLAAGITVGVLSYGLFCRLLRVEEIELLRGIVMDKLKRG